MDDRTPFKLYYLYPLNDKQPDLPSLEQLSMELEKEKKNTQWQLAFKIKRDLLAEISNSF